VAVIGPGADGVYPVAVVAKSVLARISNDLREAGLESGDVFPYALAIPFRDDQVSVFDDGVTVVVRGGPYSGFTTSAASVEPLLARFEAESGARQRRIYASANMARRAVYAGEAQTIAGPAVNEWLRTGLSAGPAVSLVPAAIRTRTSPLRQVAAAAVLVLAALLIHTGFLYAKTRSANAALGDVRAATVDNFKRSFPEVQRLVNARVQADRVVAELHEARPVDSVFLAGLHRIGEAVTQPDDDTRLTSVRYQHGRFGIAVDAPDITALERIRTRLSDPAFSVEIISAENRDARVFGRLQIEARGG
jgi:type II secretion system protein L